LAYGNSRTKVRRPEHLVNFTAAGNAKTAPTATTCDANRGRIMPTLRALIQKLRSQSNPDDCWLYISGSADGLMVTSEVELGNPQFDESTDEEVDPPGFADRGLRSTIDVHTVYDCIGWGDRLAGKTDDDAAADVIRYYIRFDAFPESLNAPDPPPAKEILRRVDREFCDKLGPENQTRRCRKEGCDRGVVKLSVYCRKHHFENVHRRAYPFTD
jgi:hypothetical protein